MVIDDPVQIIKEICKLLVVFTFYHHHGALIDKGSETKWYK
jgi:hypothetical protein